MSENKTRANDASVDAHIASRANGPQAADCRALVALLERLSGEPARMWGPSIVGFGAYRYAYESGRTGEAPLVGFAIRGRELVVYLDREQDDESLLARLGAHRTGKSCLYFKRLADLDASILERLVADAIAGMKRRYG